MFLLLHRMRALLLLLLLFFLTSVVLDVIYDIDIYVYIDGDRQLMYICMDGPTVHTYTCRSIPHIYHMNTYNIQWNDGVRSSATPVKVASNRQIDTELRERTHNNTIPYVDMNRSRGGSVVRCLKTKKS
jgi:hypothetical protein